MKDSSKTIRPFTLHGFSDGEENAKPQFQELFDTSSPERLGDEAVDMESEARRVYEEAYAQGEKAGRDMGMRQVEVLVRRLNQYLLELDSFKKEMTERTERLATALALMFAEGIVLKECSGHTEVLVAMIRKALEICEEKGDFVIRLRREDAQHISPEASALWKIIPDDALKEPGFVIETRFGDIDGRLSTQFEELKKELLNAGGESLCNP